jgi:hypothetical protein
MIPPRTTPGTKFRYRKSDIVRIEERRAHGYDRGVKGPPGDLRCLGFLLMRRKRMPPKQE